MSESEAARLAEEIHKKIMRALDNARREVVNPVSIIAAGIAPILAERDAAVATLADLRTESGKAMFASMNGWPLPEELTAARERVSELEAKVEYLSARRRKLTCSCGCGQP